jgi:asparaginyl-tRNA synthetase
MFGKPAFLSVSGQLNVETYAVGLSDVYTFGPTFRAENSHTSRHLCEFWMIEPELAFATIEDDMDCAEDYLKFCLKYVLKNNMDDLTFFDERVEKGLIERLTKVVNTPFKRVPYTEAVEILEKDIKEKKLKFENKVYWGCDLASEHEKYLTDKVFCGPIIVYNYPKDIKAFYMKMNDDGKTVQAMDVLVPKIGEVVGGSAREDRLDLLDKRIEEMSLDKEAYWWYRDLRKYGSVPHAGFGLGFERLVMMATGVENIKDVIPFPRAPGQAEF